MYKSISPAINVRTAAILTNSYVVDTVIKDVQTYPTVNPADGANPVAVNKGYSVQEANELKLFCKFTIGSLTSLEVLVEESVNGVDFYPVTSQSVDTTASVIKLYPGPYQRLTTGDFSISLPITCKYIRVSSHGTGTVTTSSLAITAYLMYV